MLVIDASALLELLLGRAAAPAVAKRIREHRGDLHAPHLVDVQVLSALRRLVMAGHASPKRAEEALADFRDLTIERHPHDPLIPRIWSLRENFSAYDATYVTVAEVLAAQPLPLLTADARLARAIETHGVVEVIDATR